LLRSLAVGKNDQNTFISPFSVSAALTLAMNGSRGTTESAMKGALRVDGLAKSALNQGFDSLFSRLMETDSLITLSIANSLWLREGVRIRKPYIELAERHFDAQVRVLDFDSDAAETINDWVADKTRGKIEQIVQSPLSEEAAMLILNAIYFKADWQQKFDSNLTAPSRFFGGPGSDTTCLLMQRQASLPYFENDNCQGVALDYGSGKIQMVVLLPKQGVDPDSLISAPGILESLSRFYNYPVVLYLPKWRLKYEATLNQELIRLGMGIAFERDRADFHDIIASPDSNMWISAVRHKSVLEVDESGTVAAAVTSVEMDTVPTSVSSPISPKTVRVDRPFLVFIRDVPTGLILFSGKIQDPRFD